MAFMFETLEVYRQAVSFADEVAELTQEFPRGCYFLTDQLNRTALSTIACIADGSGRFTKAGRRHFFRISRQRAGVLFRY